MRSLPLYRARSTLVPAACAALVLAGLTALPAEARDRYESGYHRSQPHYETRSRSSSSVDFRISIGNTSRHYDTRVDYRHVVHRPAPRPSGYYTQVWVPPTYGYRYDHCGRRYRVCLSEGYYKRVWVSTRSSSYCY